MDNNNNNSGDGAGPDVVSRPYFASENEDMIFIPSGCALLDCVLGGGWPLSRISNVAGPESSGKTLVAMEAMTNCLLGWSDSAVEYTDAEFSFDPDYAEGLGVPIERVALPNHVEDMGKWIETIEAFSDNVEAFVTNKDPEVPGLYIIDSLDSLGSEAEKERKIREDSFKTEKSKLLPEIFRKISAKVKTSNTHVMLLSQVRENINAGLFAEHYKVAGGKALDHWCSQRLFLAHMKRLDKQVEGIKRTYGVRVKAKMKKNKIGLPFRECEFEIHFGYGIDDLEANLGWLMEAKAWEEAGFSTKTEAENAKKNRAKLTHSEHNDMRKKCDVAVRKVWPEIEVNFMPSHGKYEAIE